MALLIIVLKINSSKCFNSTFNLPSRAQLKPSATPILKMCQWKKISINLSKIIVRFSTVLSVFRQHLESNLPITYSSNGLQLDVSGDPQDSAAFWFISTYSHLFLCLFAAN